jgi:hypothetical protein
MQERPTQGLVPPLVLRVPDIRSRSSTDWPAGSAPYLYGVDKKEVFNVCRGKRGLSFPSKIG